MKTFAQRIREAAKRLGQFRANELADEAQVQTYKGRVTVRNYIRDFIKRGEMERIERGLYQYVWRKGRRTQLDIIWHLIRSHRHFSTDEMERLSGAVRATVLEYLRCLVSLGYLKKIGRKNWKLINDPGPETPTNTGKCKRLREIRKRQKVED